MLKRYQNAGPVGYISDQGSAGVQSVCGVSKNVAATGILARFGLVDTQHVYL
jgi:hypothetical protein